MIEPGREGFDAKVSLETSRTRAEAPNLPGPEGAGASAAPLWRRPFGIVLSLSRRVLRPVLFRLRRYFTEPLRQDMLDLQQSTQQQARLQLELQRDLDATRNEMRVIYTSLLDQAHATQVLLAGAATSRQEEMSAMRSLLESRDASLRSLLESHDAGLRSLLGSQGIQGQQLARVENYAYASARRVALPCGEAETLVKTEAGYIVCSASDLSVLSTLVDSGDLERGTRLLIQALLRPGDVFVDVGANIGMHTLAGGHAMAAQGTIIAFEPFEPTRRLLEKSIWINGLSPVTRIHGCAVSDQAGTHTLFLGASSGHHSLFTHDSANAQALGEVQVQTVRLDDVVEPALRVNLLKIDAEGAELAVLAGAAATVRNSPDIALIVEFGPSHLLATGQDAAAWLAAFEAFGLEYRAIDAVTGALARRSLAELEAEESTNLFFARPGSAAWTHVKETA